MKNLFRSLLAVAVLFGAAACTTEDISTSVVGNGDPIEVTFTADLGAANTRAYGEGKMANELIVKIYDAHNDALLSDLCPKADEITYNNGKFTFNVVMIKGMEYKILLWAQNSACAEVYTVKDDKTLEIDYSKLAKKENNDEKLDAFYYYTPTNDTFDPTEDQPYFELRRPFAQLNAYTNDMAAVRINGIVKNFKSSVTVSAYTSFNFVNGKVLGNPTNVTFDATAIPSETDGYLSMNYLLASNDGSLVNATYVFTGQRSDNTTDPVTFTGTEYNDVPLKSNHRTNILGALLTKPTDFVVDIEADFNKADQVVATDAAAAQNALDNAVPGTVIKLKSGVNYGTLYLRPVAGGAQTKVVDWQGNNYRWETYSCFENLTIVGAQGATVDAIKIEGGTYYNTEHSQAATYPVMLSLVELKNVVFDGVTFTGKGGYDPQGYGNAINLSGNNIKVDGLTLKNCVLNNSQNNARLLYKTESTTAVHTYTYDGNTFTFTPSLKDITITGCTLNGGYMGLELRETENVSITNNEFNVGDRNILLAVNSGCTYSGNVTIIGNVSNNAKERFVRMSGAGDAVVLIKDNNINNYLGEDIDYIKVTDGNNVTIENNTISVGAQDATSAQTALDNAVSGDKIQLQPGVNYGTLIFRKTASSTVVDITTAGGDERGNEKYRRIEDLTIIGAEGAIVDGFDFQAGWIPGSGASFIDIENLTVKNVTFSGNMTPFKFEGFALGIDGLNIVDCKMNDANNNDRFVFQQMNGYKDLYDKSTSAYVMTSGIKNLTITGCEITGAYQVIESRAMENLAITNNTFRGIKARDMLITTDVTNFPDKTYTGYVTVTGNQSFDGEERFVRASLNNSDAVVVIKDNNIYNYKGADADYIKVSGGGNNVTIENNVCGKFVYGLTLIPNGENSKIFVNDKEGFLKLNQLFVDWTRLFSDGNGTEWVNYANGAGADYYYSNYWTVSLETDIDLNNERISPVILDHPGSTGAPTFDGNNHTIKNAIIVTDANTENKAGLFDASDCHLKNLKLDNIHVTGSNVGNSSAGVLSGSVNANVQNITITNSSVTGGKYTGGITGYGYTDVTNCSLTNVTVKGGYKLGGVIGYIAAESGTGDVTSNTLTDCTVDGIGGGVYAGGKSEYVIGKVVGNYNCNGTCNANTVTNMTTSATNNIGKIEAGFTVQQ